MYKVIKIVIIMGILSSIFSCKVEKDISIYRTEEFKKKEKHLNFHWMKQGKNV
ncbi:hypothetical protein HMPREF9071_2407 [Capnocytophaga sp. oral taxon 338 str. F0234]|nr:hypothetical protein HMPREF9071_2407 [Capnocytophaga sp. oral taxon 338 str. F0234]